MNDIVNHRAEVYGDPVEQYRRIALVWSGILGHEVQPFEAALMMAGMKMVRSVDTPDYSDNTDDIDGYVEIGRLIVGPDMIHARTVDEYIAQKWPTRQSVVDVPLPPVAPYDVHPYLVRNSQEEAERRHEARHERNTGVGGDGDIG